jgi:hypothetical protein
MTGWLPRFSRGGWTGSDGFGEDAEGGSVSVEWLGVIVELVVARRATEPHRRCVNCGCTDDGACIGADGEPRHWISKYVCSACEPAVRREFGL